MEDYIIWGRMANTTNMICMNKKKIYKGFQRGANAQSRAVQNQVVLFTDKSK